MAKMLVLLHIAMIFGTTAISAQQRVGIGTSAPVTTLNLIGVGANPTIPGSTSTGIFRIGISNLEGLDMGKMAESPFSGWLQAGYDGIPDPLSFQPAGGNVGIGTVNPSNKLSVVGNANVTGTAAIGTTSPNASAQLDVSSVTKGFLPPRMTFAQRNAIPNPAAGLVIWCIDSDELQVHNGTIWKNLMGGAASGISPPYVTICNQDWMIKNLDVSTYKNGDPIPKVTNNIAWAALTTGAYCYYNNDSTTYAATYGKLYNWYAVNDPRGLGPDGWHVPSDAEWTIMSDCLGGMSLAGGKMKEIGISHWNSPNTGATNHSGFTGLPGNYRDYEYGGYYFPIGQYGIWWSSTETYSGTGAYYRYLLYNDESLLWNGLSKNYGFSVRCIRD